MPFPIPGPGRSTKLTPELTDLICSKLRKTLPVEKVCDLVGIDDQTFRNWMERGQQGAEGDDLFIAFFGAVRKARAEAQEYWLDALSGSVLDKSMNPSAAFFVLERSDRKNWGRQEKIEVETKADAKGLKSSLEIRQEIASEEV